MPRFDPDRIGRLISEIRKAVSRLNTLAGLPKDKFLEDGDKIGSAKYNFIVAIEAMVDICQHIISQNGYRSSEDYADSFAVIGEQGVFDKPFLDTLRNMAKFRNRLVHLYWEVDDQQLYQILQTKLRDFSKFLAELANFLKLDS